MLQMDKEENKQTKLTDEEVWLRAYCAAISSGDFSQLSCNNVAGQALRDFKSRFKKNND